jgi:HIRAN domain
MFGWLKRSFSGKGRTIEREFNTVIAGVDHAPNGVALVRQLRVGDTVRLSREPANPHDKNAIAVLMNSGERIGYLPARIAADVTRALEEDNGNLSEVTVTEKLAEGRDTKNLTRCCGSN